MRPWRRCCSGSPPCKSTVMPGRCRINISALAARGVEMRAASAVDIALWDLFGQAVGQPIHQCLGGLSHDKVRVYNTCAGYRYIREGGGQKTGNWGLNPATAGGAYEDLDAFLNRADELAHSLLGQGITAMKIWPFDFAAEATEGRSISAERTR